MIIDSFDFDKKLLAKFIEFEYDLYRGDDKYIPPFRRDQYHLLSEHNSFFLNGNIKNFLLMTKTKDILGRISAILDNNVSSNGARIGYLGFFEAVDDIKVFEKLIEVSTDYLYKQGIKQILAPINFSTWNRYRFMTKGFNEVPVFMEPYNPAYYPKYFEQLGFNIDTKYYSNITDDAKLEKEKSSRITARSFRNGNFLRPVNFSNIREELTLLYDLSTEIFKENRWYQQMGFTEFMEKNSGIKNLILAKHFLFAYNKSNEPVGFVFGFPNNYKAIQKMDGRNNLRGKVKFLLNRRRANEFVIKTIGVKSSQRHLGLGSALLWQLYDNIESDNYSSVMHALMMEDNASRKFGKDTTRIFKEYSLYSLKK